MLSIQLEHGGPLATGFTVEFHFWVSVPELLLTKALEFGFLEILSYSLKMQEA